MSVISHEIILKKRGEGNEQLESNVMFYNHFRKTANINVKKLISLNLVLRTPMIRQKQQI